MATSTEPTAPNPFAPKNAEGLSPYLISTHSWGRTWERIEYAESLKAAKDEHAWTRQLYTTIMVRRARVADVERIDAPRSAVSDVT